MLFSEDEFADFLYELDDALLEALQGTEWEEKIENLDDETPLEERLKLYQAIRNAEVLPEEVGFFLVGWMIEQIAEQRAQEVLAKQYEPRLQQLEEEHHIDVEAYFSGEEIDVPEEYERLQVEFGQASFALTVATFQDFGEQKMAELYQKDPEEFTNIYQGGYEELFGPMDDEDEDEA